MTSCLEPGKRVLTEEQFQAKINGTDLTEPEREILRRDCGLPYKKEVFADCLMLDRIAVMAWRKITFSHR